LLKKELGKKTNFNYPAPLAALKVIKKTYNPFYKYPHRCNAKNLAVEAEEFSKLAASKICKNLVSLFFITEELKKENFISNQDIKAKEIYYGAGLGAGIMGGGIAWLFSYCDINFRLKDITQKAIALGFSQVMRIYNSLKKIGKLHPNQISLKLHKITATTNYSGFENVDIVIEAIIENLDIKKKSLAELETKIKDDTIIASNTSALSITEMGSVLKIPERFAGMHFFNPVNKMPLVEIIKGEKTSDQTILTLVKLAKKLGKTPILVKDVTGFLVNRILVPYINEATYLLQEGAYINQIDQLVEDFGMPMGPLILADIVGIDVGIKVARNLSKTYKNRMKPSFLFEEIAKNHNLLGRKSGSGFYFYSQKQQKSSNTLTKSQKSKYINPEINNILLRFKLENQVNLPKISEADILDRIILTLVNEASRCLEENVVTNAGYLDMAMILGTGFPPFRGGVLKYADEYGIKEIVSKLQEFEKKFNKRFEPSKLLVTMAENNQKFYN
jgi:3-hydroxyacyl-CoA dehydrogenase/enoyl-CoA hydratase/3-hydroxybutyryl-CoA epimerase